MEAKKIFPKVSKQYPDEFSNYRKLGIPLSTDSDNQQSQNSIKPYIKRQFEFTLNPAMHQNFFAQGKTDRQTSLPSLNKQKKKSPYAINTNHYAKQSMDDNNKENQIDLLNMCYMVQSDNVSPHDKSFDLNAAGGVGGGGVGGGGVNNLPQMKRSLDLNQNSFLKRSNYQNGLQISESTKNLHSRDKQQLSSMVKRPFNLSKYKTKISEALQLIPNSQHQPLPTQLQHKHIQMPMPYPANSKKNNVNSQLQQSQASCSPDSYKSFKNQEKQDLEFVKLLINQQKKQFKNFKNFLSSINRSGQDASTSTLKSNNGNNSLNSHRKQQQLQQLQPQPHQQQQIYSQQPNQQQIPQQQHQPTRFNKLLINYDKTNKLIENVFPNSNRDQKQREDSHEAAPPIRKIQQYCLKSNYINQKANNKIFKNQDVYSNLTVVQEKSLFPEQLASIKKQINRSQNNQHVRDGQQNIPNQNQHYQQQMQQSPPIENNMF